MTEQREAESLFAGWFSEPYPETRPDVPGPLVWSGVRPPTVAQGLRAGDLFFRDVVEPILVRKRPQGWSISCPGCLGGQFVGQGWTWAHAVGCALEHFNEHLANTQ